MFDWVLNTPLKSDQILNIDFLVFSFFTSTIKYHPGYLKILTGLFNGFLK